MANIFQPGHANPGTTGARQMLQIPVSGWAEKKKGRAKIEGATEGTCPGQVGSSECLSTINQGGGFPCVESWDI